MCELKPSAMGSYFALHPGAVILGDAFNMRHPLTGAGMSVALNDALVLREILSNIPELTDR